MFFVGLFFQKQPSIFPTPTPETISMYWEGAGDTPSMAAYEQQGRYLRFTEFPVLVYMAFDVQWESALSDALEQINTVVPIQRTRDSTQADILISLVPDEQFRAATPCFAFQTEGCAVMRPVGIPGAANFSVIGHVWLNTDTEISHHHLLLHELIHALGLLVHSPFPEDVMYNGNDSFPATLSLQDCATLYHLYRLPAWD